MIARKDEIAPGVVPKTGQVPHWFGFSSAREAITLHTGLHH